ncbi:MAG: phosphorylase [Deltaproteobacteria bacterium]|jgi:ATP adenylyltransferase|nr:phosphorylase [Deltaproteobacteria bacterium]
MMIKTGTLWQHLVETTERALASRALVPIHTHGATLEDGSGIRFFVRILSHLRAKEEARSRQARAANAGRKVDPFLPPDPELTVAQVGGTHTAVVNKFNVVDNHLLLVTRAFEDQEMLLTHADFAALWFCLREYDSLGFYNGGREAGASQEHKHLQVVPLPLVPGRISVPISPFLPAAEPEIPTCVPALPFLHSFVRLASDRAATEHVADKAFRLYGELLGHTGMKAAEPSRPRRQSMPYCLLVTREWMLLVPRSRESFEGISLNSLAFAGSLFVRNEAQYARLREVGPMHALRAVTLPRG